MYSKVADTVHNAGNMTRIEHNSEQKSLDMVDHLIHKTVNDTNVKCMTVKPARYVVPRLEYDTCAEILPHCWRQEEREGFKNCLCNIREPHF